MVPFFIKLNPWNLSQDKHEFILFESGPQDLSKVDVRILWKPRKTFGEVTWVLTFWFSNENLKENWTDSISSNATWVLALTVVLQGLSVNMSSKLQSVVSSKAEEVDLILWHVVTFSKTGLNQLFFACILLEKLNAHKKGYENHLTVHYQKNVHYILHCALS